MSEAVQQIAGRTGVFHAGNSSTWRTGAGVPSNSLGIDGDNYLNTTNGDVYTKASGTYSNTGNIKGPAGAAGAAGAGGGDGLYPPTTSFGGAANTDYLMLGAVINVGAFNKTMSIDTLYAVPFFLGRSATLKRLGMRVTTGGTAGSVLRFGIYSAHATSNAPDTLLIDGGQFTSIVSGEDREATGLAVVLTPGLYWAVSIAGVAGPTVIGFNTGAVAPGVIPAAMGSHPKGSLQIARAYGALPASFPAVTPTAGQQSSAPALHGAFV